MAFLDGPGPGPIAFAHRGFAPDGVENSMSAFERAVDLGYGYLETDAQVTADGVVLAFHDERLDRATDSTGRIAALRWQQVRTARILGREPIPLLADVLAAWPDVRVNIDVKTDAGVDPVIDVLRRTNALDRVCLGAFSGRRIAALRRAVGAGVCTAFGPAAVFALRATGLVRAGRGTCVQVPVSYRGRRLVNERFVATAHAHGLPVHVYTINDEAEMTRLLDLGVDGIMTDRADALRDVLVGRGEWTPR